MERRGSGALLLAMAVALSGCGAVGESRFNPLNWSFGRSSGPAAVPVAVADTRPSVPAVTGLVVEPTRGGAVIRATGLAGRQGWHGAELVQVASPAPGILAYRFVAEPPAGPTPVGPDRTRTLTAADWRSSAALSGVREIRVSGAANAVTARR